MTLGYDDRLSDDEMLVESYTFGRCLYPEYYDCYNISEIADYDASVYEFPVTIWFENRLLSMIVFIKNTENYDIYNIPWELNIRDMNDRYSFIYPNGPINGNIEILKAHETINLRTHIIAFGLARYWALIEYWVDGVWRYERADGFVLGPFILLVWNITTP